MQNIQNIQNIQNEIDNLTILKNRYQERLHFNLFNSKKQNVQNEKNIENEIKNEITKILDQICQAMDLHDQYYNDYIDLLMKNFITLFATPFTHLYNLCETYQEHLDLCLEHIMNEIQLYEYVSNDQLTSIRYLVDFCPKDYDFRLATFAKICILTDKNEDDIFWFITREFGNDG